LIASVLHSDLQQSIKGTILWQEPMRKHTSWHIGGPADLFLKPRDEQDLRQALAYARQHDLPVTVIGNGTNLLVADLGIRGMVLKIGSDLAHIELQDQRIYAEAGAPLPLLARKAMQVGLAGFEFLAGIPGTVGGALIMNAGAHGSAIGELVRQVTVCDYAGNRLTLEAGELNFTYRHSCLAQRQVIVTGVVLEGRPGRMDEISRQMEFFGAKRKQNQPLEYPNAGSVFKNPPGDAAGRLIELAGCKAMQVGNIQVSPHHANFMINLGGGTAAEVLELVERVQQLVEKEFGFKLEMEVQKLGEF